MDCESETFTGSYYSAHNSETFNYVKAQNLSRT